MSWTPGTPLTSEPLNVLFVEETGMKVWHEFLSGYFDGEEHAIGGQTVVFPKAEFNFQQSKIKQELDGVAIHVVFSSGKNNRCPGMEKSYNRGKWTFTVRSRVKLSRPDNHNSESLARRTADLLYALLDSVSELAPIREKGLRHIKPSPSVPSESADYRLRTIEVTSWLIFARTEATPSPTVADPVIAVSSGVATITEATAGAQVYYTLDGSTPGPTNGTLYSAPFAVTVGQTIKARAGAWGFRDSSLVTHPVTS